MRNCFCYGDMQVFVKEDGNCDWNYAVVLSDFVQIDSGMVWTKCVFKNDCLNGLGIFFPWGVELVITGLFGVKNGCFW